MAASSLGYCSDRVGVEFYLRVGRGALLGEYFYEKLVFFLGNMVGTYGQSRIAFYGGVDRDWCRCVDGRDRSAPASDGSSSGAGCVHHGVWCVGGDDTGRDAGDGTYCQSS